MTDAPFLGSRRGMSLRERFRARDSYGLLLVLIVVSLVMSAASFGRIGNVAWVLALGVTLLFALYTSGVPPRVQLSAAVVVVLAAVLTAPYEAGSEAGRAVVTGATLGLALAVISVIARRVSTYPTVTAQTIGAAVCVYLLIGITFSSAYGLIGAIDAGPSLIGADVGRGGDGTDLELVYFSFITLATVGYGDFTPATDVMRMLAVIEAFTGQLYLVTVLALVVGNIGRERRRARPSLAVDDDVDDPAQE
jgi:hypothetical protein